MLVAEFLASDEAEDLSDRKAASRCADHIIDYGCDQDFGRPLRMSPAKVETFLLDWLPRKVMLLAGRAARHAACAGCLGALGQAGAADWPPKRSPRRSTRCSTRWATFAQVYRDPATFGLDAALVARLLPDADLEALPRRAFAFPLLQGMYDGIDLSTLDPAEPEDRRTLLAADHDDAHARPSERAAHQPAPGAQPTGCGAATRPSCGRRRSGCWTGARTGTRCCTRSCT